MLCSFFSLAQLKRRLLCLPTCCRVQPLLFSSVSFFLLYVSSDFCVFDLFFFSFPPVEYMWLEQVKVALVCGNFDRIRSRTPMSRLRNRQHAEEEDASALKLGTGAVLFNFPVIPGLMVVNRIQQCRLLADIRGQVPTGEPRQGPSGHRVSPLLVINLPRLRLTRPFRVYNKTLEYVKTFAKFNTTDSASAVREYGNSRQNLTTQTSHCCLCF